MASLRLLCSPATTCFPIERQLPLTPLSFPDNIQLHSHSHISANSLKLSVTTKRVGTNFVLHFSSTAQEQALQSAPGSVTSESEELESEEVFKDRLYAQNVPWNYTPEDIRALFEKYGTVVDVEVSFPHFLIKV